MISKKDKIAFFRKAFGSVSLGTDGVNIAVKCPSCGKAGSEKKKLTIHIDTDQHHCWVCDLKGRNLLSTLRRFAPAYAREYQEKYLGKKYNEIIDKEEEKVRAALPPGFRFLVSDFSCKDPDVRETITYAKSRGITLREFWKFKFGTCSTGRFRRRLIMPSFDDTGELNYFVARSIDSDTRMKYLNAKVPKRDIIFNELNINWNKELTIVEGPMDLIKCNDNATCILGSHFSEKHKLFQEIVRHNTPVLLALDPDALTKSQNFAKKLSSYGIEVRVLVLDGVADVGELSKDEFLKLKGTAKCWSVNDRLYHMINSIKSGSIF